MLVVFGDLHCRQKFRVKVLAGESKESGAVVLDYIEQVGSKLFLGTAHSILSMIEGCYGKGPIPQPLVVLLEQERGCLRSSHRVQPLVNVTVDLQILPSSCRA